MTLHDATIARRLGNPLVTDIALVIAGSVLMTVAAKMTVPFYPVPLSMQTFVAIGLGLAMGPVRGGAGVIAYLAAGVAGYPVFAGTPEKGLGVLYLAGPTGGFLMGFLAQAVVAGLLAQRGWGRSCASVFVASMLAAAAIYPFGLLWLGYVIGFDKPLLALGLFPFVAGDLVKAALAALLFPAAWKLIAGLEEIR